MFKDPICGMMRDEATTLHAEREGRTSYFGSEHCRQNVLFAFLYNTRGIPVAAGVLYPFLGRLLRPIIAGTAMSLSYVSVISNALRLRKVDF